MNSENDEIDHETLKQLLLTTREKLIEATLVNIELETALKIEREAFKLLNESRSGKQ